MASPWLTLLIRLFFSLFSLFLICLFDFKILLVFTHFYFYFPLLPLPCGPSLFFLSLFYLFSPSFSSSHLPFLFVLPSTSPLRGLYSYFSLYVSFSPFSYAFIFFFFFLLPSSLEYSPSFPRSSKSYILCICVE